MSLKHLIFETDYEPRREIRNVTFTADAALIGRLDAYAEEYELTRSSLLIDAIQDWLASAEEDEKVIVKSKGGAK